MKNVLPSLSALFTLANILIFSASCHAGVNIQHWNTPSGARVYFVASPSLPIMDVRIDFVAGDAYDPAEKSGLASLTTGMLNTGAQFADSSLNEEQIAEKLADLGASLNAHTEADRSGLSLRSLSTTAERNAALNLMQALLKAPSFPEDVLKREKTRLIAAIQEAETQPGHIASKHFAAAIYPKHPYGLTPSVESIGRITRNDLLDFWHQHFNAKRAVISIIGAISRTEAEAIAQELSHALPESSITPNLPNVTLPQRTQQRLPHPATQSHIYIGMPAIKRGDADFFPLLVGNYVLGGGGFVSRLMKEVREKRGYAYSVYSYFDPRKLEGPFQIGLQTKRSQADAAIKVVETSLDDFLKNGPTASELKAAKQNLVDGLALKLDSNAKILSHLAIIGFYDLPLNYLDEFPRRVEAVSADQIRAAFARHVQTPHLVTVIVAADEPTK